MSLYVFIFHFGSDIADQRAELEFDEDIDALEAAENLAKQHEVDVWTGERLVAQITKGERATSRLLPGLRRSKFG